MLVVACGRISILCWLWLHELLAIVTHPRIFTTPTPLAAACDQVEVWLELPRVMLLTETPGYWTTFRQAVEEGKAQEPLIHDVRVADLFRHHGIQEFWTADRDFSRVPSLSRHNPLMSKICMRWVTFSD